MLFEAYAVPVMIDLVNHEMNTVCFLVTIYPQSAVHFYHNLATKDL